MGLGVEIIGLLVLVAFVAGTIDAIAGGGGLLTIPALLAAGLPPVAAIATNKVQSACGTGGAVFAFARKGHVDLRRFALPALASFAGSAVGAWVLTRIDPRFLAGLIPVLLIVMIIYYVFSPRMTDEDRHTLAGGGLLLVFCAAVGWYDGFFGPGTGSFFTTGLVAVFGLGLTRAVAHTKLLNFASNLAGLAVLVAGGHVVWLVGLTMALGSLAGGQFGAHLAIRFGTRAVRPLLIVMCLALTIKLLADPANPLTAFALARL